MPDNFEGQYQHALATERFRYQKKREEDLARQQEENQQGTIPMGWGIFLSSLFLSLVADILEISVIGAPLIIIIDIILGFMLGFSKGAKKQWKKWIAGFLPIPLARVALLIWSFVSSRSTMLQQIGKLASASSK